MNMWFAGAAALSALVCGGHVVAGGREAVVPLFAVREFDHTARYLHYYCWHLVTMMLAAIALAFGYSAGAGTGVELAAAATGLAFLAGLWSLAMIARFRLAPLVFGQWALFLPIAGLGLAGMLQ